jgi:hypothetical protein
MFDGVIYTRFKFTLRAVNISEYIASEPITVAARSEAWMSVCVYSVFVLSCV